MNNTHLLQILSVEDNPADRYLVQHFFSPQSKQFQLHFAVDGCEALDFVFKRGKYQSALTPDLVLLDLNLQKKDGREVLEEIKKNSATKNIRVFILTTSIAADDRQRCLELGAEEFLSKPSDLQSMHETFQFIASKLILKPTN